MVGTCITHTEHIVTHTTHETFTRYSQNSNIKIYTYNKQHTIYMQNSHTTHTTAYTIQQYTHKNTFIHTTQTWPSHTQYEHLQHTKVSAEYLTFEATWQMELIWALVFERPWSWAGKKALDHKLLNWDISRLRHLSWVSKGASTEF